MVLSMVMGQSYGGFVATADHLWRLPGAIRSAERRSDRVQVLEDLAIGPEHAGLVVADAVLAAELPDDRLRLSQLVPGHAGEEVVFDLIVEATVPEVRDRVGAHVAARQHLAAQEVYLAVLLEHRHCLVVWREDRDHEHTVEPAVNGDEHHRLHGFENGEQHADV